MQCSDSLRALDVGVPAVGTIGPQPPLHPSSRLAVAIRNEIVGVAPRYGVIVLKVQFCGRDGIPTFAGMPALHG